MIHGDGAVTRAEIKAMRAELAGAKRTWKAQDRVIREMAAKVAKIERSLQALASRAKAALRRAGG